MPGIDADDPVLRPRELYESQDREQEHSGVVERLKRERREFLEQFPALSREIVSAVKG